MLGNMRNTKNSLIVWVLLGALIIGLAGFGIGGSGGFTRSIGSIGATNIALDDYSRNIQNIQNSFYRTVGRAPSYDDMQQLGLFDRALQATIIEAALKEALSEVGLSTGDQRLQRTILENPQFQGLDGTFDRQAFDLTLRNQRMTTREFEEILRMDITRDLFANLLVDGVRLPDILPQTLSKFFLETRDIRVIRFARDDLDDAPPTPSLAEAQAFYDENPDLFQRPEARLISYALLSPDMLTEIDVDAAEIQARFDARKDQLSQPERRVLERLVFSDIAKAKEVYDSIQNGSLTFEEVVAERALELSDISLGAVARAELSEAAGALLFDNATLGVFGPVESTLGPAIFRVNEILPEFAPTLENSSDDIAEEIRFEMRQDLIGTLFTDIEDLLASGATLEELGQDTDMTFGEIRYDETMREGIAAFPEFQEAARGVEATDFPELITLSNGGIFALRLDEIIPPGQAPFEESTESAISLISEKRLKEALFYKALQGEAALKSGKSTEALDIQVIAGLGRQDFAQGIPAQAIQEIFLSEKGRFIHFPDAEIHYLFEILDIIEADVTSAETGILMEEISNEFSNQIAIEMLRQFALSHANEAGLALNQPVINQINAQLLGQSTSNGL